MYINALIGDDKLKKHSALPKFLSPGVIDNVMVDISLPEMIAKESLSTAVRATTRLNLIESSGRS